MDNCETRLGVGHKLVLIGLPVGSFLCRPTVALCFGAVALYLAERDDFAISAGWLATLAVLSAILSMVLPPIHGALLISCGILLTQLGLPSEGIAVMAVLSVFLDAASTAYSNAYLQLELVLQAHQESPP